MRHNAAKSTGVNSPVSNGWPVFPSCCNLETVDKSRQSPDQQGESVRLATRKYQNQGSDDEQRIYR
jgi:hypothetical protein